MNIIDIMPTKNNTPIIMNINPMINPAIASSRPFFLLPLLKLYSEIADSITPTIGVTTANISPRIANMSYSFSFAI